jgi:hypothetical protein
MKNKIECSAYKEQTRTFYRYTFTHQGARIDRVRECTGPLSRGEFLACIEAIEEAKKVGFVPEVIKVTSKAVKAHCYDISNLSKTSELFRVACVLSLLLQEGDIKIQLDPR